MRKLFLYVAVAAIGGAAAFGFTSFHYGSGKKSEAFAVEPKIVTLAVKPNSTTRFDVSITNNSDQRVNIVGADRDCSCLVAGGLPIDIEPRGTHKVDATFTSGDNGPFSHQIEFYIESTSGLRRLPVEIRGEVLAD